MPQHFTEQIGYVPILDYNEQLSNNIIAALGKEYEQYSLENASMKQDLSINNRQSGALYNARYDDIPSAQLGLKPGIHITPDVLAKIKAGQYGTGNTIA